MVGMRGLLPASQPGDGMDARQLSGGRSRSRSSLLQVEELHLEQQRRVRRDHPAGAARAVAEVGRDQQRALAADLHAGHALVPALDDLALAEAERERAAAIERAVELLALGSVDP